MGGLVGMNRSVGRPTLLAGLVVVLSAVLVVPVSLAAQRHGLSWAPPLHTEGRYIVDANGNRFKLKSGNWHGASGTWDGTGDPADPAHNHAGEVAGELPLGLDRASVPTILASFHELGINSIRLQFSNEMIH